MVVAQDHQEEQDITIHDADEFIVDEDAIENTLHEMQVELEDLQISYDIGTLLNFKKWSICNAILYLFNAIYLIILSVQYPNNMMQIIILIMQFSIH